jgi:hypothetical protein
MGASTFVEEVKRERGLDLRRAFMERAEESRYESGRSYSGEIGMKHEVKLAPTARPCSTLAEARTEADRLLEEKHENYRGKWGPCWAIEVPGEQGGWVFFGWAVS